MPLKLTTYYQGKDIPELPGKNIFHSPELFRIFESTSGYTPLMIVGYMDERPVYRLLASLRKKRCNIYGTGEALDENIPKEEVFNEILVHLTKELLGRSYFIEFRNLDNALFGYKYFREQHYFPINWLKVHNSLHSLKEPMARFSESRRRQIRKGLKNGATVSEAVTAEEVLAFAQMLKKNYSYKVRKRFPGIDFFRSLIQQDTSSVGKIFIVKYKQRVIGGSACIYSDKNAYLWFSAGMRKTYPYLYPGVLAVWKALEYAYKHHYEHLEFMEVGLPFKKHGYRDFVLRFGGKQTSTRRWFRFRYSFLNRLMEKIYI